MADGAARQVVISGAGLVCSLGHERREIGIRMREMRHGFVRVDFPGASGCGVQVAAPVPDFALEEDESNAWAWPERYAFDPAELRSLPPHGVYALAALWNALAEAGLDDADLADGRTGLYCASNGSPRLLHHHLDAAMASQWRRVHPLGVVRSIAGSLNINLAARYGITGPICGFASACASGAHALGFAMDAIRFGRAERMLVVAGEDFSAASLLPFAGMQALSLSGDPDLACRPFDAGRDGFVGTGGAAALMLEAESAARARGCVPLARLLGWAESADGSHIAVPDHGGAGIERAMRDALVAAGLVPGQVTAVSAHAPSTPAGDRAEALALRRVFDGACPAITAPKSLIGHGLSAAAAMETVIAAWGIDDGWLPGIAGLRDVDPCCGELDLATNTRPLPPGVMMKNASGFGGANVSLLLAHPDYQP